MSLKPAIPARLYPITLSFAAQGGSQEAARLPGQGGPGRSTSARDPAFQCPADCSRIPRMAADESLATKEESPKRGYATHTNEAKLNRDERDSTCFHVPQDSLGGW